MKLSFILLFISLSAFGVEVKLKDYDWKLTDIANKGLTKESLYESMDQSFIRPRDSICSNRALMWANDFKKEHNLNTGKIFLYYTKKKGSFSLKTWWYHVSPVVNENGKIWVLDAGFPGWLDEAVSVEGWLEKFAPLPNNCKEIQAHERDLIDYIFYGRVFPTRTAYGTHNCYYKIVPHTIWTPEIMAMNLLGMDRSGTPVRVERDSIDKEELYTACLEATTNAMGYFFGNNKKQCKRYAELD